MLLIESEFEIVLPFDQHTGVFRKIKQPQKCQPWLVKIPQALLACGKSVSTSANQLFLHPNFSGYSIKVFCARRNRTYPSHESMQVADYLIAFSWTKPGSRSILPHPITY